jgi:hypothetical protein
MTSKTEISTSAFGDLDYAKWLGVGSENMDGIALRAVHISLAIRDDARLSFYGKSWLSL